MELDEYRRMAEVETSHWWYRATRDLLQTVLGPNLPAGGRRLDAGCGTGATGAWLAEGDADAEGSGPAAVFGADMEHLALSLYREAHESRGLAVADLTALPYRDGAFDALLCVTVLCHRSITDPGAVVGELARVVRPGGVICLMEPGVRRLRRAHDRVTHSARRFSRADLADLLVANGLGVLRSTGAYSFLIPPAAIKAVVERGRTSSDLDSAQDGLGGLMGRAASLERRWLATRDLPAGLSVIAIGRRPQ